MKVFLSSDMEGTAGVVDGQQRVGRRAGGGLPGGCCCWPR